MTKKELLINEINQAPEPVLDEVLDFVLFLKIKTDKREKVVTNKNAASLKKDFLKLIEEVGTTSIGGNSV